MRPQARPPADRTARPPSRRRMPRSASRSNCSTNVSGPCGPVASRVQQIACQQDEIRLFRQRRLEDPHRRAVRRLQQQLPQVFRDLGNPGDRPMKMEIGRVNEAEWPILA